MRTSGKWRHCIAAIVLVVTGCNSRYVEYVEPVDYSRTAISTDDSRGVWVSIRPTQCSTYDAWRNDWVVTNEDDRYPFKEDIAILRDFCSKHGIVVFDIATRTVDGVVCMACTCKANRAVFFLVREEDVGAMLGFGFRQLPSD